MSGGIVFAGISPHPPLLAPEVGGDRIAQVAKSRAALREFSRRLINANPDSVAVISPHSPFDDRSFLARSTALLHGDFGQFGAGNVRLCFNNDLELLKAIEQAAVVRGLRVRMLTTDNPLDHGALVPLYYLAEQGWDGPVVVIGFTAQSNELHVEFGRAVKRAAVEIGRKIAFIASGDLSHRLTVDGPYRYEPTAHLFDEQIVRGVDSGDASVIMGIDTTLRYNAGECGYRSILVGLGVAEGLGGTPEVLSYEGPFGVGYMVAILAEDSRLSS